MVFQVEGEGEEAEVVNVEPPGMIYQSICAIGRIFVLIGAIWKGNAELNEMRSLGLKKYFQTTVITTKDLLKNLFDEIDIFIQIGFWSS